MKLKKVRVESNKSKNSFFRTYFFVFLNTIVKLLTGLPLESFF